MSALLSAEIETSLSPRVALSTGDPAARGAEPGFLAPLSAALRDLVLGFVRPRVTIRSSLLPEPYVTAPWGEPLPWWLGLTIVLVPVSLVVAYLFRRARGL